jgi:hypothetical protein
MKGHVSVTGGVYSEGNIHTYKSSILIDGQWYAIPDHLDDYEFKYLIREIKINYVNKYGGQRKDLYTPESRTFPVKVIYDYNNAWDYTPKDGDVFDGYGIEVDLETLYAKYSDSDTITAYEIVWTKNLNIKK